LDLNDWILALHLLSAFALVAALTVFSILIVAQWRATTAAQITSVSRIGMVGAALVMIGVAGTLVFGLWLTFSVDGYSLWDAWILIALALWAVGTELGRRAGRAYAEAGTRAGELAAAGDGAAAAEVSTLARPVSAHWYHIGSTVAVILVLIDMIWKPGA
jgi:hypothetical protein